MIFCLIDILNVFAQLNMSRKKQEVALQVEIETQEEWEEMLSKEGLTGEHASYFTNLKDIPLSHSQPQN